MPEVFTEIILVLLLIIANGLFSMSEMALVSARKARLRKMADEGSAGASAALVLAANPNDFLSTVQIGITLIGILAGAYGGASISKPLAEWLGTFPTFAEHSVNISFIIVVTGITFLSLVIGELVPKQLALSHAERIAASVAPPMRFISFISAPFVRVLGIASTFVLWALRIRVGDEQSVTEEEVKLLLDEAARSGHVEESEQDIVHNVLALNDIRVSSLMTRRSDLVSLDIDEPVVRTLQKVADSKHTYYPVYDKNLENVLGLVSFKQLFGESVYGRTIDLRQHMVTPLYVPQNTSALKLLELFKQSRKHIALAIDEYGGIQGIVTITDVLESMVGELSLVEQNVEPQLTKRDDGSWLIDGLASCEILKKVLKLNAVPDESIGGFDTVGGMMMTRISRIPRVGDRFEHENMRFEVVDMDGNRVDKIMVTPLKQKSVTKEV
jgi:putative hemolysin